jgi:hypothetical protein
MHYHQRIFIFSLFFYPVSLTCMELSQLTPIKNVCSPMIVYDERLQKEVLRTMWHPETMDRYVLKEDTTLPYYFYLAPDEIHQEVAKKQEKMGISLSLPIPIFIDIDSYYGAVSRLSPSRDTALLLGTDFFDEKNKDQRDYVVGHELKHIKVIRQKPLQIVERAINANACLQSNYKEVPTFTRFVLLTGMSIDVALFHGLLSQKREKNLCKVLCAGISLLAVSQGFSYVRNRLGAYKHVVSALQQEELDCDATSCLLGDGPEDVIRIARGGQQNCKKGLDSLSLWQKADDIYGRTLFSQVHPRDSHRIACLQRIIDEQTLLLGNGS